MLKGGLKVYATLDPVMQQKAQDAMDKILPEKPGFTGSLVAMDPTNGFVKAMVAGPGFENSQYNIATSYPGRQAGSTWKVDHARRRARDRVLAERHRRRHVAVRVPAVGQDPDEQRRAGRRRHAAARRDRRLGELRVRPDRARGRVPQGDRHRPQDGHHPEDAQADPHADARARSRRRRSRWRRSLRRSPRAASTTRRCS